jgi:hypothetical protein
MDIMIEIERLRTELNTSIKEYIKKGIDYATAYRDYRIELAKELLYQKELKTPATTAYDIARGKENVANAKFKEISTEAYYKAELEKINSIKLQLRMLETQYKIEFGGNE